MISGLMKLMNIVEVIPEGVEVVGGHLSPHLSAPHHHVWGAGAWGSANLKYRK